MTTLQIETHKLSNGNTIPMIGLGTFRARENEPLVGAIKFALQSGYRHLDCAWIYGNEADIGQGIREAIAESQGTLKREDLFITSKVWNTNHSHEAARQCLKETLTNLGVDYVDLYLIHWPFGFKENAGEWPKEVDGTPAFSDVHYLETYKALEEMQREGKIKNIGVSNFNISQLQDVLDHCEINPVVNQFEVHPYLSNKKLIDFCQANEVLVEGYAPFGTAQKHDKHPELPILIEHPVILTIAKAHSKTAAQICIRWGVQQNVCMLPKSVTPSRILENSQVFDFTLSDEEMNEINGLNKNLRFYELAYFASGKFYPFKE